MPTPLTPTYRRLWCVSCQEWELFVTAFGEKNLPVCNKCKTPLNEEVLFGDIPREKILEQRKRYNESKKREFGSMITMLSMMGMGGTFSGSERRIIEHDAGQKAINEERARIKQEEHTALLTERAKYKGVGRNEPCPCLSGKKFKNCHISIM